MNLRYSICIHLLMHISQKHVICHQNSKHLKHILKYIYEFTRVTLIKLVNKLPEQSSLMCKYIIICLFFISIGKF